MVFERFAESIQSASENPPEKIIEAMMQNMKNFSGSENFQDDVTIVVLDINGVPASEER